MTAPDPGQPTRTGPLIDLTDATVHVRDPQPACILGPISLTVEALERVAVIGPSGAGKSTLVSVLGGMGRISSGRYRFGGDDLTTASTRALCRFRADKIGFLFQHAHLIEDRTVAENVALGLSATPQTTRTVPETLHNVGIERLAQRRARHLSGGERHRVALARALVKQPTLLIADEPTGSLDRSTGTRILDLLEAVTDDGTTLLLVTHDPEAAARADRTLRIVDGTLQ